MQDEHDDEGERPRLDYRFANRRWGSDIVRLWSKRRDTRPPARRGHEPDPQVESHEKD